MNDLSIENVRVVAEAILHSLGDHAPPWSVLRVEWTPWELPTPEPDGHAINLVSSHSTQPDDLEEPPDRSQLSVVIGPRGQAFGTEVGAYFPLRAPTADAIVVLASQIQDHAAEAAGSRGFALPPCPAHSHPMNARVVDGIAVWQCPTTPSHFREPIIPAGP